MSKLGILKMIKDDLKNFIALDRPTILYLVSSDIEIYGRKKYLSSIDRAEKLTWNKIQRFITFLINQKSKKDLDLIEKEYVNMIDSLCYPDKPSVVKDDLEKEVIKSQKRAKKEFDRLHTLQEEHEKKHQLLNQQAQQLFESQKKIDLSEIENECLNYIKDKNLSHSKLLSYFSQDGIHQIANRAALKVILFYSNAKK